MGRPAVFLDRDGVLIENRDDYVKSYQEVRFLAGVMEALQKLRSSPFTLVLVTNQSVVGRGLLTLEQAISINRRIIEDLETQGTAIAGSYLCPHHPDDGCTCRKPAPGMLFRAEVELDLDLKGSFLVGDVVTDIQAAQAAGVQGILVLTGRGSEQLKWLQCSGALPCPVVPDLPAAVDYILAQRKDPI